MLSVTFTLSDWKGNRYGFKMYPIGTDFDAKAGVYLFTKRDGEHKHEILYVGETASFKEHPLGCGHEKWGEATRMGMTHIGVFPTPNRLYVQNRLIQRYNPPYIYRMFSRFCCGCLARTVYLSFILLNQTVRGLRSPPTYKDTQMLLIFPKPEKLSGDIMLGINRTNSDEIVMNEMRNSDGSKKKAKLFSLNRIYL